MNYTTHTMLEQGSPEWLELRKGRITGSRFKDARDRTAKGLPTAKCSLYAMDVARERCGGKAGDRFQNAAMRFGTEQEPLAREAYERATGNLVFEVGFITDESGYFGLSPDGLIDDDGVLEIKTMVSSETLFRAVVDGDISEYLDQIHGYLWMLGRQWVDLVLWAPDLTAMGLGLKVIRIERDEDVIAALQADLHSFLSMVQANETRLLEAAQAARVPAPDGEASEQAEQADQASVHHVAQPQMPSPPPPSNPASSRVEAGFGPIFDKLATTVEPATDAGRLLDGREWNEVPS